MVIPKEIRYQRILLKLSGEALMGDLDFGIDPQVLDAMALEIGQLVGIGVEVGLLPGWLEHRSSIHGDRFVRYWEWTRVKKT